MKTWVLLAFCYSFGLLGLRCPGYFPQCKTDEECRSEEGNKNLLSCCDGQCQECCSDRDCLGDWNRCKDYRCLECMEDSDCSKEIPLCHANLCVECWDGKQCPEKKPICRAGRCATECAIYSHCFNSDMPGRVCKEGKCVFCEKDTDCYSGMSCVNKRCIER